MTTTIVERHFDVPAGDVTLAGTLVLPDAVAPAPAVLLLPGSGPVNRDSDARRAPLGITRHLADALANAGIASLRYDKRGVGDSGGTWRSAGMADAVADARCVLAALARDRSVDADRLAVVGHSEGALLAARLAAEAGVAPKLRAAVLLSSTARPGGEVLAWQARVLAPTLPAPVRLLLRLLRTDLVTRQRRTAQRLAATTTDTAWVGGARVNARWFREFMAWDPRDDLRRIRVPVLALTGSKDLQADPEDVRLIRELVPGDVSADVVPDVNHILRFTPGAPSLSTYRRQFSDPLDPRVMERVTAWLADRLAAPPEPPSVAPVAAPSGRQEAGPA